MWMMTVKENESLQQHQRISTTELCQPSETVDRHLFLSERLSPSLLSRPMKLSAHVFARDSSPNSQDAMGCVDKTMFPVPDDSLHRSTKTSQTEDDHHSYTGDDDVTKSTDETEEMLASSFRNSNSTIGLSGPIGKPTALHTQTEGADLPAVTLLNQAITMMCDGDNVPIIHQPTLISEDDTATTTDKPHRHSRDSSADQQLDDSSCTSSTLSGISSTLSRWGPLPKRRGTIRRSASHNDSGTGALATTGSCHQVDSITSRTHIANKKNFVIKVDLPPYRPRHHSISPRSSSDMSSTKREAVNVETTGAADYSQASPGRTRVMAMFRGKSIDIAVPLDCGLPPKPQRQCSGSSFDTYSSVPESATASRGGSRPPSQPYTQDEPNLRSGSESDQTIQNSTTANGEDSSTTVSLTPSEIEAYVLARIPAEVREKLAPEDWNRIFSELAINAPAGKVSISVVDSKGSEDRKRQENVCHKVEPIDQADGAQPWSDERSVAELSDITFPAALPYDENESTDSLRQSPRDSESVLSSTSSQTTRSHRPWHENLNRSAPPRMPQRGNSQPALLSPLKRHNSHHHLSHSVSVPFQSRRVPLRSVSFDTVEIRHYERVLDLNPATSSGPSLGLGWQYIAVMCEKVSEYEMMAARRSARELVIPRKIREDILKDIGYTSKDVARAVRINLKAKNQRKQTIHNLAHQKMEEMVETSSRKVRQLLRFPSMKKSKSGENLKSGKLVQRFES